MTSARRTRPQTAVQSVALVAKVEQIKASITKYGTVSDHSARLVRLLSLVNTFPAALVRGELSGH